jgi:hypothetical protein
MPEYLKKRRISKRTATTRLFTDDEREVQRRATNEGKERSEIIRQAVSNAFRTERLALARKDETMQPVVDTYRKMMEEATGGLRNQLIHLTMVVEDFRKLLRGQMETTNEHLETLTCSSRYNTEQAIVIRALMQLYIFDVYHQLEMQCGLDPALLGQTFKERVGEFRWDAGNEMARIMEDSAEPKNQSAAEQLIEKLYRHLIKPLPEEAREPRW